VVSDRLVPHTEEYHSDPFQRCCGDEPFLFKERWEKLFEDFCDVKPEKFDPSRVCFSVVYLVRLRRPNPSDIRLANYTTHSNFRKPNVWNLVILELKYLPSALHHRVFLFAIFNAQGDDKGKDRTLHELYARAKALFDLVAPQEYGIDPWEK
jgi:inositol hexakisphosphate/diphosphoinositol-pentakisphosphate kinase